MKSGGGEKGFGSSFRSSSPPSAATLLIGKFQNPSSWIPLKLAGLGIETGYTPSSNLSETQRWERVKAIACLAFELTTRMGLSPSGGSAQSVEGYASEQRAPGKGHLPRPFPWVGERFRWISCGGIRRWFRCGKSHSEWYIHLVLDPYF